MKKLDSTDTTQNNVSKELMNALINLAVAAGNKADVDEALLKLPLTQELLQKK